MRRTQWLFDGLSRCLCPSVDERAFAKALSSFHRHPDSRLLSGSLAAANHRTRQRRQYSASATRASSPQGQTPYSQQVDADVGELRKLRQELKQQKHHEHSQTQDVDVLQSKRLREPLTSRSFESMSTEDILKYLESVRNGQKDDRVPNWVGKDENVIVTVVRHLVEKRNYPLNAYIYECMMDAMKNPRSSAGGIRALIKDIVQQEITPSSIFSRSALEALAVHPDYVTRQEIIDLMKKYWIELDRGSEQSIMLGLLRDGQYEMAFNKLTKLHEDQVKIDRWIYDVFIVVFSQLGFMDEVYQILPYRKHAKGTDDAFRSLLLICLDRFSRLYHYDGTLFVWESAVRNSIVTPSNAIIANVLGTAARHADPKLATEALELLSKRGRVHKHQYEAVIEAFAGNGNIAGAFGIFPIMESSGLSIDRGSSRAIYEALTKKPELTDEAAAIIRKMHEQGQLSFEIVRVTIEAIAQVHGSEAAKQLYHEVVLLTSRQPDYTIMEAMILHCTDSEMVWELAKDYSIMIPKDVPGEGLGVYDKMIPACAEAGDFDLAFALAARIRAAEEQRHPRERTWQLQAWVPALVDSALTAEDGRIWPIVDEVIQGDDDAAQNVQAILRRLRISKVAGSWRAQKD